MIATIHKMTSFVGFFSVAIVAVNHIQNLCQGADFEWDSGTVVYLYENPCPGKGFGAPGSILPMPAIWTVLPQMCKKLPVTCRFAGLSRVSMTQIWN
jgi:hypothetical protein